MQRFTLLLAFGTLFTLRVLAQMPPLAGEIVTGYSVEGNNPLTATVTAELLGPFVGELEGFHELRAAALALQAGLHERGYSSYRVIIPEQTLEGGVVRLRVLAFVVGEIEVKGNEHFSDGNIQASVPALKPGMNPDMSLLTRQLLLANEHPSMSLSLTFREGKHPQTIDALLKVEDFRPWNVFATFNNFNSVDTPDTRLLLGLQHSNLFNRDHDLTLTAARAPDDWTSLKQYGGNYSIPLYGVGGKFSFYYIYSDLDSGRVAGSFDVSGQGKFFGGRYAQQLAPRGRYRHTLVIKIEDNRFENETEFAGQPIGSDVRSRPLSLGYEGRFRFRRVITDFYARYERNLPGGSDNNDEAYALSRLGARSDWDAWQLGGSFDYSPGAKWLVHGRLDTQYSSEPLIPGEQFGAGGAYSVRGYHERIVAGDSGLSAGLEAWSPPFVHRLQAIGFIDAGYTNRNEPAPSENDTEDIYSLGLGLRWFSQRYLSLRLDVAHLLSDAGQDEAGETRLLFNLAGRY